jgi:hypothetical protein
VKPPYKQNNTKPFPFMRKAACKELTQNDNSTARTKGVSKPVRLRKRRTRRNGKFIIAPTRVRAHTRLPPLFFLWLRWLLSNAICSRVWCACNSLGCADATRISRPPFPQAHLAKSERPPLASPSSSPSSHRPARERSEEHAKHTLHDPRPQGLTCWPLPLP